MPTFKEMLEAKKKEQEEAKTEVVPPPRPDEFYAPSSDFIRTAYFLLVGRSTRKSKDEIIRELGKVVERLEVRERYQNRVI